MTTVSRNTSALLLGFVATAFASSLQAATPQPSLADNYNFVKLDYPGAAVSYPLSINNKREIVGVFFDSTGVTHGYFYALGTFTAIDYPGAAQFPGGGTFVGGLNDRGDMGGTYSDSQGYQHGFTRLYPDGCSRTDTSPRCQPVFHSIDVPGAVQTRTIPFELGYGLGTDAAGINNLQEVVGIFATKGLYSDGFKLSHGQFTALDDPASSHLPGMGSRVFSINDLGFIAGAYQTQDAPGARSLSHGFLYTGLNYVPVQVAGSEKGGFGTQANGVNIFLDVVGVFSDPQGMFHGFLWAGGQPFLLDFPGAPYSEAHSINNHGDVTGAYIVDLSGFNYRGFVAYRKDR